MDSLEQVDAVEYEPSEDEEVYNAVSSDGDQMFQESHSELPERDFSTVQLNAAEEPPIEMSMRSTVVPQDPTPTSSFAQGQGTNPPDVRSESPHFKRLLDQLATHRQEQARSEARAQSLAQEVVQQGEDLESLHTYVALCERRLRELSPEEPFPVTETNLGQPAAGMSSRVMQRGVPTHIISANAQQRRAQKEMAQTLANLERERGSAQQKITELKQTLRDQRAQGEQREKQLLSATRRCEKLTQQLRQAEADRRTTQQHVARAEAKLTTGDRGTVLRKAAVLQRRVDELEEERRRLLETLRQETESGEEQRAYIEVLKNALDRKMEEAGFGEQQGHLLYELSDLTHVAERLKDEAQQKGAELDDALKSLDAARQDLESAGESHDASAKRAAQLESELAEEREAHAKLEKAMSALEEERKGLFAVAEDQVTTSERLSVTLREAQAELEECKQARSALEQRAESLENHNSELQQRIDALATDLQAVGDARATAASDEADLRATLEKTRAELKRKEDELADADATQAELLNAIRDEKKENTERGERVETLATELQEAQQRAESGKEMAAILRAELQKARTAHEEETRAAEARYQEQETVLNQQLDDSNKIILELHESVKNSHATIDEQLGDLREKTEQLDALREALEDARSKGAQQTADLRAELERAQSDRDAAVAKARELQEEARCTEEARAVLEREGAQARQTLTTLEQEKKIERKMLHEEIHILQQESRELAAKLATSSQTLTEQEAAGLAQQSKHDTERVALETQLLRAEQQAASLQSDVAARDERLTAVSEELSTTLARSRAAEARCAGLEEKLQATTAQLAETREDRDRAREDAKGVGQEAREHQVLAARLQTQLSAQTSKLEEAQADHTEHLQRTSLEHKVLLEKIRSLEAALEGGSALEAKAADASREIDTLRAELSNVQAKHAAQEAALSEYTAEEGRLQQEKAHLAALREEMIQLYESLAAKKASQSEVDELRAQRDEMEVELRQARHALRTETSRLSQRLTSEATVLHARVEKLTGENAGLAHELQGAQEQLNEKTARLEEIESQHRKLRSDHFSVAEQRQGYEQDLMAAVQELESLRASIALSETARELLQKELDEAKEHAVQEAARLEKEKRDLGAHNQSMAEERKQHVRRLAESDTLYQQAASRNRTLLNENMQLRLALEEERAAGRRTARLASPSSSLPASPGRGLGRLDLSASVSPSPPATPLLPRAAATLASKATHARTTGTTRDRIQALLKRSTTPPHSPSPKAARDTLPPIPPLSRSPGSDLLAAAASALRTRAAAIPAASGDDELLRALGATRKEFPDISLPPLAASVADTPAPAARANGDAAAPLEPHGEASVLSSAPEDPRPPLHPPPPPPPPAPAPAALVSAAPAATPPTGTPDDAPAPGPEGSELSASSASSVQSASEDPAARGALQGVLSKTGAGLHELDRTAHFDKTWAELQQEFASIHRKYAS